MPLFSQKNKIPLGIYIHVPFCRSKCHYCDFYSLADQDEYQQECYMKAVCQHIREAGQQAPNHRVDTIYFGGGTPTIGWTPFILAAAPPPCWAPMPWRLF